MARLVEVAGVDELGDRADRVGRDQHRPEDGLFGLLVLRRDALRDAVGSDFGLDTDAPWAELERVANAIDAYLENPQ